ncbi:ABC transporter ATP-binding protein [Trinickia fusca]|uniref:ABC transporter ATP-binding protein n=1 Tax=Trinickia fusca TaxID=2419777 RepID=A0A494X6S4_9BURK|nr:ABC transporter ATP-binding protein [Trinickia fusca]RKP46397.1 ABC transporter ATP-binding protein [Trinickia fusca]
MALLEVEQLSVRFTRRDGPPVQAVDDVSFALEAGRTLGIVGESGSGKSQTVLALLGLLASNATVGGKARYEGQDLLVMHRRALNTLRGNRIAIVFQDPMTSLNPFLTIERQMTEPLQLHRKMSRREARKRAIEALERVHIPDAARRIGMYPHEFSGGMRQRVTIAMALVTEPRILIADEPTTALDVTVQAQIVDLLRELNRERDTAIILITHDMGVVAGLCDDVMVMYAGRTVEQASAAQLFASPTHPYTIGLMNALPRLDDAGDAPLVTIAGNPPMPGEAPAGCAFAKRCPYAQDRCTGTRPTLQAWGGQSGSLRACHRPVAVIAEEIR